MKLAREISTWSKDPSSKIGAVIVNDDRRILATGYNGFPKGIEDTEERLNDREQKYPRIVHAEMNVIYNATYSGVSLDGAKLYVYGLPVCNECAKGIIQVGIKEVYVAQECIDLRPHWLESYQRTLDMFNEVGIKVFAI
jgi:dCMP deaminase